MCKEKRNFTRLALHAKASMLLEDQSIEGEVENLSLKVAFVTAGGQWRLNDVVTLTIDNTLGFRKMAKVVRMTDKGMGLECAKNLLD